MSIRDIYGPWGPIEIANYLRVNRATVDQWKQRDRLPDGGTVSGRPYWWPEVIDDWAAETGRIPTFEIMNSDGSEEDGIPAWMITDGEDCALYTVPYEDGETIHDAIRKFHMAGRLPAVEVTETERMDRPYTWQIDPYCWKLTQLRIPRSAEEWSDRLDALMAATGQDAGTVISWGYADGTLCWVSLDPEHRDADDDRCVIASGPWTVGYDRQSGYWTAR
jgi:hypothetical protein